MNITLGDVKNENLYQNGVYVVNENITHVEEDAFDNCSELREVIFIKPVGFTHKMNGYDNIYGIFRRNSKLKTLIFPENQDKIYFPMLLNCASDELEIHLSSTAHVNLCKDIVDYNKNAVNKFSTNINFKVYNKFANNENKSTLPTSNKNTKSGDSNEIRK